MDLSDFFSPVEPLILTAARIELIANRHFFSRSKLSSSTVRILCLLRLSKKLTPGEIMEKVGGTKSNISQRLNLLQQMKLISRSHAKGESDKRKVYIKLTKLGSDKLKEVQTRADKAKLELNKHFSKAELDSFKQFIKKLNFILDQAEKYFPNEKTN